MFIFIIILGIDTGSANRVNGRSRTKARRKGAAVTSDAVGGGERVVASAASHGDAQTESHRVGAIRRRLETTSW